MLMYIWHIPNVTDSSSNTILIIVAFAVASRFGYNLFWIAGFVRLSDKRIYYNFWLKEQQELALNNIVWQPLLEKLDGYLKSHS